MRCVRGRQKVIELKSGSCWFSALLIGFVQVGLLVVAVSWERDELEDLTKRM